MIELTPTWPNLIIYSADRLHRNAVTDGFIIIKTWISKCFSFTQRVLRIFILLDCFSLITICAQLFRTLKISRSLQIITRSALDVNSAQKLAVTSCWNDISYQRREQYFVRTYPHWYRASHRSACDLIDDRPSKIIVNPSSSVCQPE